MSFELYGLFHARKLRVHELALRAGWDRVHAALGITKPFYDRFTPAIAASDFTLRGERARAGAGLRGRAPRAGMSERRGALALVLHTHMPYVEGFGTWPFGEEWLWEAVACVYLPLLEVLDGAPVTVGLTPVLCDQLEAMRGEPGDRYLRFLREVRAEVHAEDSAGLDRGGEHELAAEVRRAAGDYERAADEFERRGRDLLAALRRAAGSGAVDLGGHPRGAADARDRRRARPPARHGHRLPHAPLRRLGRRALASGMRLLARPRRARSSATGCAASAWTRRRPTGSARPSTSSRCGWPRARWPCPWTGRRSS